MMSCDRNGRACASAAVRNGIAGHASRSLNAISSWQTVDKLLSGQVQAGKLPEQAANLALGTVGLKVENGRLRLRNVMALALAVHALEHATGSAVTMLARTALRGQPFAAYQGVVLRRSPVISRWLQAKGKLSLGRVTPEDAFFFHQGGRTWSVVQNRCRFPGNLPEKTLTVLRSHSFPDRALYFDRALDPRDAVDMVLGHKNPETHPGFLGATNELDALVPSLKQAKQTLMAANWLTLDDSERDTRSLDVVDYDALAKPPAPPGPATGAPYRPRPAWRSPGYADIAKKVAVTPPAVKIERTSNYAQLVKEVGRELAPPTVSVSGKGDRPLRVEALDQLTDKRILAEAYFRDTDGAWVPITDEKTQEQIAAVVTDNFQRLSRQS